MTLIPPDCSAGIEIYPARPYPNATIREGVFLKGNGSEERVMAK